jgi:hypothetical protein
MQPKKNNLFPSLVSVYERQSKAKGKLAGVIYLAKDNF